MNMEYGNIRLSGKGSFRKRNAGNWEYRIAYSDIVGRKKRKSFTGGTKAECLSKAEKWLIKEGKKNQTVEMDWPIQKIVKHKYDSDLAKNYIAEPGYARNIGTLKIIEKSFLGNVAITDITVVHIDEFLKEITSYANSTIEKLYNQLKLGFQIAVDKGIVEENLMSHVELRCPKSNKPTKEVIALTEEQQALFLEVLLADKVPDGRNEYKKQLLIELYSGMRMGEINALRPEDIDLTHGLINVSRTVSRGLEYQDYIKEGTKTYAGKRQVPINNLLRPVLEEALENCRENSEGLLFYDYIKRKIISTNQVNSYFARICKKCGFPRMGQHTLRHTFATRCIEAGIQPVVLKTWLGHKDIHVTLDTYTHVFDRLNLSSIEKFEGHINTITFGETGTENSSIINQINSNTSPLSDSQNRPEYALMQ